MIGVVVQFQFGADMNAERLREIAAGARDKFAGLPGLRSKAFSIDAERHLALNFYVWDSADAARAFFTTQRIEQVSHIYGVRPELRFVEIAELVDNAAAGALAPSS